MIFNAYQIEIVTIVTITEQYKKYSVLLKKEDYDPFQIVQVLYITFFHNIINNRNILDGPSFCPPCVLYIYIL